MDISLILLEKLVLFVDKFEISEPLSCILQWYFIQHYISQAECSAYGRTL